MSTSRPWLNTTDRGTSFEQVRVGIYVFCRKYKYKSHIPFQSKDWVCVATNFLGHSFCLLPQGNRQVRCKSKGEMKVGKGLPLPEHN
jgi:hypothetical protein